MDFNVTVKIQERIDKSSRLRLASFVGNTMEGSTFVASPVFTLVAVGILTLIHFFDKKNKKIRFSALLIPVLFGLLVMAELYGKSVVHHPSPPFFMIKNPTSFFPKDYINEQFSYPSGHTARAVFMGILAFSIWHLSLQKKQKIALTIGIVIYISIVSTSRIYLGHHWLSDIIGGALSGGAFGLLTLAFISPIIDKQ